MINEINGENIEWCGQERSHIGASERLTVECGRLGPLDAKGAFSALPAPSATLPIAALYVARGGWGR